MTRSSKSGEFVQALGTSFEIMKKLTEALKRMGGTEADLRKILPDNTLADKLAAVLMGGLSDSITLAALIAACNFVVVNENITEANFPPDVGLPSSFKPQEEDYNHPMETSEVHAELDWRGLRPATAHEVVQYAKDHPQAGLTYSIVALGSVWTPHDGHGRVVCLWGNSDGRRLYLRSTSNEWNAHCRFLAFGK